MKSIVRVVGLEQAKVDLLAVAMAKRDGKLPASLLSLDDALDGAIERVRRLGDFHGDRDEAALLYGPKGRRVLLVGLGPNAQVTRDAVRRAAALAARRAVQLGAPTMGFAVAHETHGTLDPESIGQVVVEGAAQGGWVFRQLKGADAKPPLKSVELIATREERADMDRGRRVGTAIAVGHKLARNLQALPGNVCTPGYLADIARQLGKAYGFRVSVLGRSLLEKEGMHALLAVAQGSVQEPRLITIEYRGGGRDAPVCLIGKGVTFDSGGISIKPALSMEEMKYDMSGAAAVLGTFEALGQLKPAISVVGIIPSVENLPSGTALKPGDIIRSHLGKTIEIINTDAEGRLILADALSYARRFKPSVMVDAATLTGAMVIALGAHATGIMGNDEALVEELRRAGARSGERTWPLPMLDEYRDQIKSDWADIKNSAGRGASAITAGWFLREFVTDGPWVHCDIAGTAYTDADRPDMAKGPTGVGVRLFTELVLARARG